MLWIGFHGFTGMMTVLLADLGLERNPNAERGLIVWAAVVVFFSILTLWLATRRGGLLSSRRPPLPVADANPVHGGPFMKKAAVGVGQVLAGVLAVYALAQFAEPRVERPSGWFLIRPPHEASALARQGDLIWAGGKEGLFARHRQSLALVEQPWLEARDLRGVRALLVESDVLWIGCRQGLFRHQGNRLEPWAPPDGQDLGPVTALHRARDGALWIGARGGAWRVERTGGPWRRFGLAEGLDLPGVDVIYQDQQGVLWFGSQDPEAPGLFQARENGKKILNQSSGLPGHAVNDLLEDDSGVLWAATGFGARGGAARYTNEQWIAVVDIPGISGQKIRSLFADSQKRLWFCSEYNGVAIRDANTWKRLTIKDGLPGAEVKDMQEDEAGTLWLATERGLGCLRFGAAPDRSPK